MIKLAQRGILLVIQSNTKYVRTYIASAGSVHNDNKYRNEQKQGQYAVGHRDRETLGELALQLPLTCSFRCNALYKDSQEALPIPAEVMWNVRLPYLSKSLSLRKGFETSS